MDKRQFDLVGSVVGLVLAAPFMLLAAVGIALTSPGPVIYRCRRVGKGGTIFTMFKFRTMHVATDEQARVRITGTGDPRIFAFGALLRRLKIDELPSSSTC